jgi:thymidylate synthase (FAD)
MAIVKPSYELLYPAKKEDWEFELKKIEKAGRTAYKTEDAITDESYHTFVKKINTPDSSNVVHGAVLEFGDMTAKFVTDRGISHEIVRHRLCSFLQESTRYCNYSKDKFDNSIDIVIPSGLQPGTEEFEEWRQAMVACERSYLNMTRKGVSPQIARSVLPTCTKTEIMVKANFREWQHIFKLRVLSKRAHPDIRRLFFPLYTVCREEAPEIFDLGPVEDL